MNPKSTMALGYDQPHVLPFVRVFPKLKAQVRKKGVPFIPIVKQFIYFHKFEANTHTY